MNGDAKERPRRPDPQATESLQPLADRATLDHLASDKTRPTPTANPTDPQKFVGKYEIRKVLGRGGQADALLAFDTDLHRHVVIKVYHSAKSSSEQEEVLNEGRALARVRSSYVAQCLGADRHDGMPYLVLEYVPGVTLSELHRAQRIVPGRAIEITQQIAEGLSAIHACGLLHRDLKPSNIIVSDDGRPRIVDFGLATSFGSERLQVVSGTPAYMSPEQARGETERIDPRTDIFGLGAILYELLTGRPPYQAENVDATWAKAKVGVIESPADLGIKISAAENDYCMRCLAKDPANRFGSATQAREAALRLNRPFWRNFDLGLRFGRWQFRLTLATSCAVVLLALGIAWWQRPDETNKRVALIPDQPRQEPAQLPQMPAPSAGGDDLVPGPAASANAEPAPPMPIAGRSLDPAKFPLVRAMSEPTIPMFLAWSHTRRAEFPIDVEVVDAKTVAENEVLLEAGAPLSVRIQSETDCYSGVWYFEAERVVQLFPNDVQSDPLIKAGESTTVPSDLARYLVTSTSDAPDRLYVLAKRTSWQPARGRKAGALNVFGAGEKPALYESLKAARESDGTSAETDRISEKLIRLRVVGQRDRASTSANPDSKR